MSTEYREFNIAILLGLPLDPETSTSNSSDVTYQYLTHAFYEHDTSEEVTFSMLKEVVIEEAREVLLELERDSELKVRLHELDNAIRPVKMNPESCEEAYKTVDRQYLRKYATELPTRKYLTTVKDPNAVIAILTVIAPPKPKPSARLSSVQEVMESDSQIEREKIAIAARDRDSPSTSAHNSQRILDQVVGRPDALHNHRPMDLSPRNITMYHPVFAKFMDLMSVPHKHTMEEYNHASDFVNRASRYYQNEASRIHAVSTPMAAAVHSLILTARKLTYNSGSRTLEPDGVITSETTPAEFTTIPGICEVKVEPGVSGDALAQAECGYIAIYSSEEARDIRECCCCPALIIGMEGPFILVGGAVFVDQFMAQTLCDPVSAVPRPSMEHRSSQDDAIRRIARLFRALRECLADLDVFYKDLVGRMYAPAPLPNAGVIGAQASSRGSTGRPRILPSPAMIGPFFNKFRVSPEKEVVLEYTARLLPRHRAKAVFVATAKGLPVSDEKDAKKASNSNKGKKKSSAAGSTKTKSSDGEGTKVVVKITPAYSREAHELLSKATPQQAPTLWYCEYEPRMRMFVVVMDYVVGKKIGSGLLTKRTHIESLRKALGTLHAKDLVFGDLREPNVLLVQDKVVLIDFDWCGKDGSEEYPTDIAIAAGMWHEDVGRGEPMRKVHDEYHFRKLTGQELAL